MQRCHQACEDDVGVAGLVEGFHRQQLVLASRGEARLSDDGSQVEEVGVEENSAEEDEVLRS